MIIKEVELHNFRIYYGSNSVVFTPTAGKNIFVTSGFNGFGKTTFLMSLVWCLYGRQMDAVDEFYEKEIKENGGYQKYISGSLNRLARTKNENSFSVSITFEQVQIPTIECNEIKITRKYNIDKGSDEEPEILIDGKPNELTSDIEPDKFIREFIMPLEIAKFFFFDAEKIISLASDLNSIEQKRKLSSAYSEVLGIKKYENLRSNLEKILRDLREKSASPKELVELNDLNAKIQNIEIEIEANEIRIDELDQEEQEIINNNREIQDELIKSGNLVSADQLQALKVNRDALEKDKEEIYGRFKDLYENLPFAIGGDALFAVNKQVSDEINYRNLKFQAEQVEGKTEKVLEDLNKAQHDYHEAIPLKYQEFYNQEFRRIIKKYFYNDAPEIPSDFKTIHDFTETEKNELEELTNVLKYSFKNNFKSLTRDFNHVRNELSRVEKRLSDAESKEENPRVTELRNRKSEFDIRQIKIREEINDLKENNGAQKERKSKLERDRNILSDKIQVSKSLKNKDEYIKNQINHLNKFLKAFKDEKKTSLEKRILDGLKQLMHKKDFIHKVDVSIVDEIIDIKLFNKRGEQITILSRGEQQLFATALLRGLVEESEIKFPVFIDSPMQKFDEQHSANIIKYFYPNISDQVVILPLMNKELNEQEYELIKPNVKYCYIIDNIDADQSRFEKVEADKLFKVYNNKYKND
ncbi:MAG: DNA sulfur modification protein DndD [Methanobacteriaceae archaeon]